MWACFCSSRTTYYIQNILYTQHTTHQLIFVEGGKRWEATR
jgi:hypothetical protein